MQQHKKKLIIANNNQIGLFNIYIYNNALDYLVCDEKNNKPLTLLDNFIFLIIALLKHTFYDFEDIQPNKKPGSLFLHTLFILPLKILAFPSKFALGLLSIFFGWLSVKLGYKAKLPFYLALIKSIVLLPANIIMAAISFPIKTFIEPFVRLLVKKPVTGLIVGFGTLATGGTLGFVLGLGNFVNKYFLNKDINLPNLTPQFKPKPKADKDIPLEVCCYNDELYKHPLDKKVVHNLLP